jgi:hypothetical protein
VLAKLKTTGKRAKFFLDLHLTFSKVGPLQYQRADGTLETEYLTEKELFDEESLATATGKPVTFLHPPEGMVTKENVRRHTRGTTGTKILRNDPFAVIVATVHDAELIEVIKSGRAKQVSAGYTTNVVKGDDGKLYQTSRCYNHLVVVPYGRAGELVKVHYDDNLFKIGSNDDNVFHAAAVSRHKTPLRLNRESRQRVPGVKRLPNETGPFDHLKRQP